MINPGDQKSFPLFGDDAGSGVARPWQLASGPGLYQLGSDGSGGDLLSRPAGGSRISHQRDMGTGPALPDHGRPGHLQVGGVHSGPLDPGGAEPRRSLRQRRPLVHPHQANVRIIHAASDVLGFHRDSVYKNLERYGNTSAGSIPIALDELHGGGKVDHDDLLLISGFGSGLNWGTPLWRW